MKKILIVLGLVLLLSGCKTNKTLDFKNIGDKLVASKDFENHEVANMKLLSDKYNIDTTNIKEALVISPKEYNDATIVLVVLPNDGKKDSVKKEIDSFISSYNMQWVDMNYFPEQKELVKDALYKEYNNYIIYIVSKDNESVLNTIIK